MSRLSEVTNLPLLKIFAGSDFGRGEGVLPPTVGTHDVLTGLTGRVVVSHLSEVRNLPLLKIFAYIDFG